MTSLRFEHELLSSMKTCQAAVKDKPFTFFENEFHTLKECSQPATKKVTVDDGDSYLYICTSCLAKYLTKLRAGTNWIGWFDCDIAPEARVKGSKLYWSLFLENYNKANPKNPLTQAVPSILNTWLSQAKSPLKQQIEELETWLKTAGKTANPFDTMKNIKLLKELKAKRDI